MINNFLTKLSSLIGNKVERCLVIEELDHRVELTVARVDSLEKKVMVEKNKTVKCLNDLRRPIKEYDRLILGFNSKKATTIESVVNLKRPESSMPLNEAEIDGLLFRGLWEFLNHYRSWAAKKMNISEIDLILANIEVTDVRLGNHRVFNPEGFRSKDFSLRFRGTFIPRSASRIVERFRGWAKDFIVVETIAILTSVLAKFNDLVVHTSHEQTTVFVSKEDESLYLKSCDWGRKHILKALAEDFKVNEDIAFLILNKYLEARVSSKFQRFIEQKIREQIKSFFQMLSPLFTSVSMPRPIVHFYFRFTIPFLETFFNQVHFRLASVCEILRLQGFSIDVHKRIKNFSTKLNQSALALLVYPFGSPKYEFLNQLLRRRAKWLIANN
ncbi:MAG: hypothetical protein QMD65_02200 [Patescibacteria group bacterium]|nr:hypothetical protein [Patescibacteria group bacterium]